MGRLLITRTQEQLLLLRQVYYITRFSFYFGFDYGVTQPGTLYDVVAYGNCVDAQYPFCRGRCFMLYDQYFDTHLTSGCCATNCEWSFKTTDIVEKKLVLRLLNISTGYLVSAAIICISQILTAFTLVG